MRRKGRREEGRKEIRCAYRYVQFSPIHPSPFSPSLLLFILPLNLFNFNLSYSSSLIESRVLPLPLPLSLPRSVDKCKNRWEYE